MIAQHQNIRNVKVVRKPRLLLLRDQSFDRCKAASPISSDIACWCIYAEGTPCCYISAHFKFTCPPLPCPILIADRMTHLYPIYSIAYACTGHAKSTSLLCGIPSALILPPANVACCGQGFHPGGVAPAGRAPAPARQCRPCWRPLHIAKHSFQTGQKLGE